MPVPDFFIKNVRIPINDDYELTNTPYSYEDSSDKFKMYFEREEMESKFLEFLNNNKGAYLVTGYRGSGKTSFVNRVIKKYNGPGSSKKIVPVFLNLAQSLLTEIDVLRIMVAQVNDKYFDSDEKKNENFIKRVKARKNKFWNTLTIIFLGLLIIGIWKPTLIKNFFIIPFEPSLFIDLLEISLKAACWLILILIFRRYFFLFKKKSFNERKDEVENFNSDLEDKLTFLNKRCYASVTSEKAHSNEFLFTLFNLPYAGRSKKRSETLPAATSKEIEYALSNIIKKLKGRFNFMFVFDELDKIDPPTPTTSYYQEIDFTKNENWNNNYLQSQRNRKQAVINLVAGLKNFITTAEASFVFIAGREMFDASLADVADRQSSLGSIFNYVFNVDSFLKDRDVNTTSLSKTIERYLCGLIFGAEIDRKKEKDLFKCVIDNDNSACETYKIGLLLQNFIIYLTYRTNGSPKKLIKTIHEFIRKDVPVEEEGKGRTIVFKSKHISNEKKRYLYFNYHTQYKIGFINYLYRPFLIKYGRNFKQYSDNIIVSTSYLFDHLLKFHPFGFNISSLELIPEVLSTNKTPTTKEHLKAVVEYLKNSHVKETEVGLFNYKFYNRTLNELSYQSKLFEAESAAFNFTLDESFLIKTHVRNKIKELRSIYAKFNENSSQENNQVHSIALMNNILGDLHFFDQEYDDSIVAYSDAIKPLGNKDIKDFLYQDFITLSISMLKIGLCYEKIVAYEQALAWYSDASEYAIKFLLHKASLTTNENHNIAMTNTISSAAIIELLQVSNQAFLAMAVAEEKMSIESNSAAKLPNSVGKFFDLIEQISKKQIKGINDQTYLVKTNTYLVVGNLFYYRNSIVLPEEGLLPTGTFSRIEENLRQIRTIYGGQLSSNNNKHRFPVFALALYFTALQQLLLSKNIFGHDKNDKEFIYDWGKYNLTNIVDVLKTTNDSFRLEQRFTKFHFRYLAILLSSIGDSILASLKEDNFKKIRPSDLISDYSGSLCVNGIDLKFLNLLNSSPKPSLVLVIKYYYLSAFYFVRRGRSLSASFQLRKILILLKAVLYDKSQVTPIEKAESLTDTEDTVIYFLEILRVYFIKPLLEFANKNAENTENHMAKKFEQKIIDQIKKEKKDQSTLPPNEYFRCNLSNHPEVREIYLLYNYIAKKLGGNAYNNYEDIINSYNAIATQHCRIMELEYYAFICRLRLENESKEEDKITHMIGYISALVNNIRILNFYGSDYMLGFSHQATIYYKIGKFYNKYVDRKSLKKVNEGLKDLFGDEYSYSLYDASYYFSMAKLNYEKALQLHSTGDEYNKSLDEMIYLEDDFNDNAYHFGAALDRYFMINNLFTDRINKCS
ncbi:hypothetical protein [Parafilimonas terrae]|uniref:AAA ATPase domain-containing protein n=1 Tax=Parafilimonas terrae TaxID=1465490 RepID=A0A1I5TI56_9BACT|nr:hypothetical protein [Parafilimonas terrae]SFP82740.1 hypothetical protein SAMN05444277_102146 [Parafilimonas terrae]